jgi:hypothetical protein
LERVTSLKRTAYFVLDSHLATLKDNEKVVFACKLIAKSNIIEKLKQSSNPEKRKEYIINSLKKEVLQSPVYLGYFMERT